MVNIKRGADGRFLKSEEELVYTGREKEYKQEWYLKNKKRLNEASRQRYQKNRAQHLLYSKIYQSKHIEKTREYKRINKDRRRFDGTRESILKRDSYECRLCGEKSKLVIHHIDGTTNRKSEKNANNNPINLITLCRSCHIRVHKGKVKI